MHHLRPRMDGRSIDTPHPLIRRLTSAVALNHDGCASQAQNPALHPKYTTWNEPRCVSERVQKDAHRVSARSTSGAKAAHLGQRCVRRSHNRKRAAAATTPASGTRHRQRGHLWRRRRRGTRVCAMRAVHGSGDALEQARPDPPSERSPVAATEGTHPELVRP